MNYIKYLGIYIDKNLNWIIGLPTSSTQTAKYLESFSDYAIS